MVEGVGGGENVIMFEGLLKRNLPIYFQPRMAVFHPVDAWKLKRRYFINLHFVSGKNMVSIQWKALRVMFWELPHLC